MQTREEPSKLLLRSGHAVVFGVTQSGKTTLVKSLLLPSRSRCLVVDPHGEYGDVAVVVRSPEELAEYLRQAKGSWRIAYSNDHLEEDFAALCRTAYSVGNLQIVIDEADWWCTAQTINDEYARLVKYGIGHGGSDPPRTPIYVCSVSRYPAEVNRMITSQAATLFCFLIVEPPHLDYIAKYAGEAVANRVPKLEVLQCVMKPLHAQGIPMLLQVNPETREVDILGPLEGVKEEE